MTTLVEGGTPTATVHVRHGETMPVPEFAAGELREYVESGTALAVTDSGARRGGHRATTRRNGPEPSR